VEWGVVRTKPIGRTHGIELPVFIDNFAHHYTTVRVYSDGLIDCWFFLGCVDLSFVRRKIEEGWIVTQAPAGAMVSFANLGWATVGNCNWQYTTTDFVKRVEKAIETLNPIRRGLVDMNGEDVEIRDGIRYKKFGFANGRPYFTDADKNEVLGASMPVFVAVGSETYLSRWFVYADGSSRIGPRSVLSSVDEIAERLVGGDLATSVPNGAWINIEGVGRFRAQKGVWVVKPGERAREALDKLEVLRGGIGSFQHCWNRFLEYQSAPCMEAREVLRQAYESVPEHLRPDLGDTDSQDWHIRKILYGRENWTGELAFRRHPPPPDY
jgi:hypothetical protein